MRTYVVASLLAFTITAALTPLLRAVAPLIGGLDRAQSTRKVHTQPIPRIGGVGIVAAFLFTLAGLLAYRNDVTVHLLDSRGQLAALIGGGLAISALGLFDDLKGAGARLKFLVQFGVAALVYLSGFQIHVLVNPFGGAPLELGWLALPFTAFWIVGIINATNLIDGLDGLAGGTGLIAVGAICAIAAGHGDVFSCLVMAALGGALVGFLLYNFNPASIFMGDTGSMFLGFVLAVASIRSSTKSSVGVALLGPIVALGLPIADTLLAMVRRALRGRPLFSADKEHIHHKLLARGLSHRQTVLALYAVCVVLGLSAFAVSYANSHETALVMAALVALLVVSLGKLGYLPLNRAAARRSAEARARNQQLRQMVRSVGEQLDRADGVDVVWESVRGVAGTLQAQRLTLSLVVRDPSGQPMRSVLSWRGADAPPRTESGCLLRMDLRPMAPNPDTPGLTAGTFEVEWSDGRLQVERDDEIVIESLVDHIESALNRVGQPLSREAVESVPGASVVPITGVTRVVGS